MACLLFCSSAIVLPVFASRSDSLFVLSTLRLRACTFTVFVVGPLAAAATARSAAGVGTAAGRVCRGHSSQTPTANNRHHKNGIIERAFITTSLQLAATTYLPPTGRHYQMDSVNISFKARPHHCPRRPAPMGC